MERFLDAQIHALNVIGLKVPGSESMVFHGTFPCSFENLTVAYSGKDVFTSSSHAYSECVSFSQGDKA